MGLAASQARLLSITSRISDNELRAQLINNQKMRLSSESSQVSENYINALNKTNLVFANYDEKDNAQNVPLTFNNLTAFNQYNNQYGLTNTAGNILISETEAKKYQASMGATDQQAEFLKQHGIEYTTSYWDELEKQLGNSGITYSSTELRTMYEGVTDLINPANNVSSYDETVKTQEYTDFSGYLDDFIKAKGFYDNALEKATKEAINGVGNKTYHVNGADRTLNGIIDADPVDLFKTNAKNLKDLLTTVLNDNCKPGTDVAGFVNSHFNSTSDDYINMEYNGSKFIQKGNYEDLGLGANAPLTSSAAGTNSLLYTNGGFTYINIGPVTYDEATGKEVIGWIKVGDPTNDMAIYKKDGGGMSVVTDTDEDGNTQNMSVANKSYTSGNFSYTSNVEYQDDAGNTQTGQQTMTIKYNPSATNVSGVTAELSGDKNGMSEGIAQALTTLLQDTYAFLRTNMKDVDATTSSDPDIQKALTECINIGQNLANTILGTKDDGSAFVTIGKDNIDDLYNYIQNVVDGKATPTDPCLGRTPKKEFGAVVNAYILDTMMDIFGEPVYGYLYTNGAGTVQPRNGNTDASAEAKWYINLFNKIQSSGYQVLANGLASSTEWLQFALENGIVVMEQVNSDDSWQGITYTSCSDISEQTDSNAATIAEAEYNKAMRQIEAKDEMFDLELKNIDTEHSSLEAEYESVKKAMSGNIERNFQMYS